MPDRWTVSHKLCGCKWEGLQIWAVSIWCLMNQKQEMWFYLTCYAYCKSICQIIVLSFLFIDIWPLKPHPLRSLCSRWKPTQALCQEPLPSVYLRYTFVSTLNKGYSNVPQHSILWICLYVTLFMASAWWTAIVCRCTRYTVAVSMVIS